MKYYVRIQANDIFHISLLHVECHLKNTLKTTTKLYVAFNCVLIVFPSEMYQIQDEHNSILLGIS